MVVFKNGTIILTAFLCLTVLRSVADASVVCSDVFTRGSRPVGISLVYAVPLVQEGKTLVYNDRVLVEVFDPSNQKLMKQESRRYLTPSLEAPLPFGKEYLHETGLKAIYGNYGDLVESSLVKTVIEIEKSLPLDRQSTYLITPWDADSQSLQTDVQGFIRIFDGTHYQRDVGTRARSNYELPLERILRANGGSTHAIENLRSQGESVYEIGKYFIEKGLAPERAAETKRSIMRWLAQYVAQRATARLDHAYFFVHVASKVHRIAYQRNFGFRAVERSLSEGLSDDEDILSIRGDHLYKVLSQYL